MVMAILSMLLFLMLLFATVVVGAVVCTISDPICVAEHNARTGVTLAEDKEGDATCCGGCGMTVADAAACTAAGCQPMIPHTTYSVVYDGSTPIGTEATLWYQDGGCYAGTVTKTYDTAACSANAAAIAATPNPTIASPQTVLEPCDQETVDASTDFSGANTGCKSDLEDSTDTWCAYIGLAGFCCFLELVLMFCIAVPVSQRFSVPLPARVALCLYDVSYWERKRLFRPAASLAAARTGTGTVATTARKTMTTPASNMN